MNNNLFKKNEEVKENEREKKIEIFIFDKIDTSMEEDRFENYKNKKLIEEYLNNSKNEIIKNDEVLKTIEINNDEIKKIDEIKINLENNNNYNPKN
jgi:hypothetical protein